MLLRSPIIKTREATTNTRAVQNIAIVSLSSVFNPSKSNTKIKKKCQTTEIIPERKKHHPIKKNVRNKVNGKKRNLIIVLENINRLTNKY